jgi:hypothetical protein
MQPHGQCLDDLAQTSAMSEGSEDAADGTTTISAE